MGEDAKRSLQALFLPWESWKQREKASLRRALLAQGNVGQKEREARARSSERAGGAGCGRGTLGESVVPLEKAPGDAQLGTLSRGQTAGSTGEQLYTGKAVLCAWHPSRCPVRPAPAQHLQVTCSREGGWLLL